MEIFRKVRNVVEKKQKFCNGEIFGRLMSLREK
jgi:hypothetical protein